ncbi:hypothetical protein QBC35DRAFT_251905 [Podospora australis]|uniref:N-acetyltransferase domain-containing protein n=1 Tax=Podospora australis TaxID=1536484 RepID=A0AAN6WRR0_9PEZI|nr:hypothetical protein QBC35DRAFT_251905 [Podospora australis]
MPAILDDPSAPTIFRVSGDPPYPDPGKPSFPSTILPRHVTLRDRQTVATVIPFASRHEVPESLLRYLSDQFSKEIEGGDTYPMMEPMSFENFSAYWFQNFAGIMLLGQIESAAEVIEGKDWSKECLGTFYIKPNYPGRSSHICNAGFIVTDASRNRGVGRLMGETYLEWAPKLGYKYSVFNLVYETNVASCKIWDALGFKRIGRVKGAGNLKSHPDRLVDAIIYGRDLGDAAGGAGNEELVSEERFDKIKFYLKYGRYPNGADRAEKSRLRSAATHYKLLDGDVLMLKDKEVISDPQRQYEIAKTVHNQAHAGINKTTATIAERYHWSRIKETVSDVIRNCTECKELGKASSSAQTQQQQQPSPSIPAVLNVSSGSVAGVKRPNLNAASGAPSSKRSSPSPPSPLDVSISSITTTTAAAGQPRPPLSHMASPFTVPNHHQQHHHHHHDPPQFTDPTAISLLSPPSADTSMSGHHDTGHNPMLHQSPIHHHHLHDAPHRTSSVSLVLSSDPTVYQPIDPQIISQSSLHHHHHHHHQQDHNHAHNHDPHHHDPYAFSSHHAHHHHHDPETDAFQALINAADDDDVGVVHGSAPGSTSNQRTREEEEDEAERAAVDRDLEMLIEQPQDDDEEATQPQSHPQIQIQPLQLPPPPPPQHQSEFVSTALSGRNNSSSSNNINNLLSREMDVDATLVLPPKTTISPTTTTNTGASNNSGKMNVSHLLSSMDDDDIMPSPPGGGGIGGGL